MTEKIDALFIPFYSDIDRWHNDMNTAQEASSIKTITAQKGLRKARMVSEGVIIDEKAYDLSRFLSWVHYGSTVEYERYDSYSLTLLSGCYYSSLLRRHGFNIYSANATNKNSLKILAEKLDPQFVLLSTTLILEHIVLRDFVSHVRKLWPEAIIVLGGLFLVELQKTNTRKQLLELLHFYNADVYIISSHGETPLLELLKRGARKSLIEQPAIPNTYVMHNKDTILEPPFEMKEEIMPLADNYIRWRQYVIQDHLYHAVHTRTARSCAFKCAFCNFPINQGPLMFMPVDVVKRELEELKSCSGVDSIIFTDDTFNVPLKRFKELCRVLAQFDFTWYSFFRPQFCDTETAQLMKAAHCKAVFAGIESVDNLILKNMNKKTTIEAMKRGIEKLKKVGICIHANFVIGFPGETQETVHGISKFLDEMEIEFFTLAPWHYVPSTPIHRRKKEFGLTGAFGKWKHKTMSSEEAYKITKEIISQPKYSVHVPELAANNFWSEIMLYCNGFSTEEAHFVLRTFNKYMGRYVSSKEIKQSIEYSELHAILSKHQMPKPINI